MALTVFEKLLKQALAANIDVKSREALYWFKSKAAGMNVTPKNLLSEVDRLKGKFTYGKMYCFSYDPKTKEELPYYDKFPLIFPLKKARGGFLGINVHYLPHAYRAKLMDALNDLANNNRYNHTTRLIMTYKLLDSAARFKMFRPCVKHYLFSHVQSKFVNIDACEWNIALFLPIERFAKQSKQVVWKDSIKKF